MKGCEHCGADFHSKRPHARFCSDACRAVAWKAKNGEEGGERVLDHPLAEARAQQEATDLKSKLSQIIYQGIVDRLKYGPVHADDLEPLFPEEVRDVCRKLVGAQFGSLASRGYIVESERRKSKIKSRKGAKSGVFVFTAKGREKLVGVDTGVPQSKGTATSPPRVVRSPRVHSGEKPNNGTINPEGNTGGIAGSLDRPDASEIARGSLAGAGDQLIVAEEASEAGRGGQSASASGASSEVLELPIEEAPARPLSPFTDAEAA